MKHLFKFLVPAVAVLMFAAACDKTVEIPAQPGEPEQITIKASLPESTKVAYSELENNALHLAWEANDCIRVFSGEQSQVFTIKDSFTDHEAEFTGTAIDGTSFSILYPGTYATIQEALAFDYDNQTQVGNGSTAHLSFIACLQGVDSYQDFSFTKSWAESHGGTFFVPGIVKIIATLPSGVTTVKKVALKLNPGEITLNLQNVDVSASSQVLTAYVMLPWGGTSITGGNAIDLVITDSIDDEYGLTFALGADTVLQDGRVSVFKFSKDIEKLGDEPFAGGTGIEGDPYLIATPGHMQNISTVLADGKTVYFKMIDDVDMTGETWAPLNNAGSFEKGINFDGDNRAIINLSVSDGAYPSFAGVLNGTVKNVIFDGASIEAGGNTSGVVAGYVGSSSASVSGSISGITVKNSKVLNGTKNRVGGIAGYVNVAVGTIDDCHVIGTTVTCTAERVGGMFGQLDAGINVTNSTAVDVNVSGGINVGGMVGVCYGNLTNCNSSGSITSTNTTSNKDIGVGGLVGYFENGTISKCYSTVNAVQTTNGRDVGGLIGKMLKATVEKSYCTGTVTGLQRNVGGFVGLITLTSGTAVVSDCYCTGPVSGNAYSGGFLGLLEKGNVEITNCYSTSSVSGSFGLGGIVGFQSSATLKLENCAAWNSAVTASSIGASNWSSGAVIGVTVPVCTLTNNYRNPAMSLAAYWVPDASCQHADVSSSHPLTDSTGAEMTDTGTGSGQPHYPQYPYHGKVDSGKTLSELASSTLGWSSSVWDFSGSLPALK